MVNRVKIELGDECRCFFAELLTGKPIFPGKDEAQQMAFIFDKCGDPNEADWPGVSNLTLFKQFV